MTVTTDAALVNQVAGVFKLACRRAVWALRSIAVMVKPLKWVADRHEVKGPA